MKALRLARRLVPYMAVHTGELVRAALAALVLTGAELSRPLILRHVIDDAVPAADIHAILFFGVLFVGILVVSIVIGYYQLVLMASVGISVVNRLKSELFSHLLRLDLAFFDRHKVGWLISRAESDGEQIKQLCSHIAIRLFTDGLVFTAIIVTLYRSDADVARPMLAVVALMFCFVFGFLSWIRGFYDDVRTRYSELVGFISEYVGGIQIIQLYNRQTDIRRELNAASDAYYDAQVKSAFCEYGFWAFFSFVTETVLIGVIVWVGVGKYCAGTMSLGKLVMFIQFARQMTWPLHSLSENLNQIPRAFVAAERLFGLLDEAPSIDVRAVEEKEPRAARRFATLTFRDVAFRYGAEGGGFAVSDLNFQIRRGETVAIVGPSGGGKSTTANLLCRFADPTQGAVLCDDVDLRDIPLPEWRRTLGLVLQDVYLFPGTVLDNLRALDRTIDPAAVRQAAERLGAASFIARFPQGYDTELAERGANLSAGERQLLSFTRALCHDPELLILDEATSSIDPQTEALLQQALERLLDGRTAVIIAHRLSTIRRADRILVFDGGRIRERGTHDELLAARGLYERLYTLQARADAVARDGDGNGDGHGDSDGHGSDDGNSDGDGDGNGDRTDGRAEGLAGGAATDGADHRTASRSSSRTRARAEARP